MSRRREEIGSARWVLFGGKQRDAGATGKALAKAGALGLVGVGIAGMSPSARQFAQQEVAGAVDAVLEMDAIDILAAAWWKHRQIADARRRTQSSGGRELIELAEHQVTSVQTVHIDVVVDHVPRQRIDLSLTFGAHLVALGATISAGEIVELRGGDTTVTAKLMVAGIPVLDGKRKVTAAVLLTDRASAT